MIGTWVNSDDDPSIPSNVTRLCRALRSSPRPSSSSNEKFSPARREQIIYYHRGIGTNGEMESKWVGGGTGDELSEHARECYGFLCNNWREGDDIALFGFSRGSSILIEMPFMLLKAELTLLVVYRRVHCPDTLGSNR